MHTNIDTYSRSYINAGTSIYAQTISRTPLGFGFYTADMLKGIYDTRTIFFGPSGFIVSLSYKAAFVSRQLVLLSNQVVHVVYLHTIVISSASRASVFGTYMSSLCQRGGDSR